MNPPAHAGGTDYITAIEARTEPLIKNKNAPKALQLQARLCWGDWVY